MWRLVAAFTLALLALAAAAPAGAQPQPAAVYIVNASTTVTDAQIANAVPAFQQALDTAFSPAYGSDPTIVQVPTGQAAPFGGWTITIQDQVDSCWCYGYHDVAAGVPVAYVETDGQWTITFTHELFEMLADPYVDRVAGPRFSNQPATKLYTYEVCDPVEDNRYAWTLPGADGSPVLISDFVTDNWFSAQGGAPLDYMGHVHHAGVVLPGGYIWILKNGTWREIQK